MRGPSFEKTKGPGMTAPGEACRQPLEPTPSFADSVEHLARFAAVTRRLAGIAPKRMRTLALTLPEQTWNASKMTRADWMAAERAFNRREPLPGEYDMGQGRWSKWSNGADECHALEFGFKYRFDIRGGPKTKSLFPDFWYASSRDGSLGEFSSFEAAALACENEARRLIETTRSNGCADYDFKLIEEQWTLYLALPNRLQSRKTRTRYR